MPGWGSRGGTVQAACRICGKVFEKRRADPKRHCSLACGHKGAGLASRRRVQCTCKHCGLGYEIPHCHINAKKHMGQFCSRACTYAYWREHPEEHPTVRAKGGFTERIDSQGYVWISVPGRGRVRQHVLVMEQVLGRRLEPWETVHHKNGIRSDNWPENLEVWQGKQPAGVRSKDAIVQRLDDLERRVALVEARMLA